MICALRQVAEGQCCAALRPPTCGVVATCGAAHGKAFPRCGPAESTDQLINSVIQLMPHQLLVATCRTLHCRTSAQHSRRPTSGGLNFSTSQCTIQSFNDSIRTSNCQSTLEAQGAGLIEAPPSVIVDLARLSESLYPAGWASSRAEQPSRSA